MAPLLAMPPEKIEMDSAEIPPPLAPVLIVPLLVMPPEKVEVE